MHPNNTRGIRPENPFTSGRTRRFKRRSRRLFRGQNRLPSMNSNSNTNSNTSFNSRNNNSTKATKNKPIRHNATKTKNPIKNKTLTSILNHYYRQGKLNEVHTTIASKY